MTIHAHLAELERRHRALEDEIAEAMNHPSTDDLKLAEQVLKVLPKPKLDAFQNPFAGDDLWR